MNNFNDICVCCGCYVPEGRQICPICEENELDNLNSEIQAELLKLELAIEEAVSAIQQLAPLIEETKQIFLELWNNLNKVFLTSKKYSKIIHLAKHGKTARIRKKNRVRLIRLFLREKYKPG